jgi:hypothetical protein
MAYEIVGTEDIIGDGNKAAMRLATVVIAATETASDVIHNGGYSGGTFQIPAAFTGANVQPKFSNDGVTFTAVGSAISVSANGTYEIPALCFRAKYIRLDSASAEGASRTLKLFLRST